MAIAYAPLDIDVRLPDEKVLIEYCNQYFVNQESDEKDFPDTYNNLYSVPVYARGTTKDWYDPSTAQQGYINRYNHTGVPGNYANGIDKLMPEIPYILSQLPYKELTVAMFFVQKAFVRPHYDTELDEQYDDLSEILIENEPHRINVLLTNHGTRSFFVSEFSDSQRYFPNITKERPCYAFCERYHYHGADYVAPNKILLTTFGILDREKHRKMINESIQKYPDEIIRFPDPINPLDPKLHWTNHIARQNKYPSVF